MWAELENRSVAEEAPEEAEATATETRLRFCGPVEPPGHTAVPRHRGQAGNDHFQDGEKTVLRRAVMGPGDGASTTPSPQRTHTAW